MEQKIDLNDAWKKLFLEMLKQLKEINQKLDNLPKE